MMFGFGISNFFALPFAVSLDREDEVSCLTFWIGPFFVEIGWNER